MADICAACGRSLKKAHGSDLTFCETCGRYTSGDSDVYVVKTTERMSELSITMNYARHREDLHEWRNVCREYVRLEIESNPQLHGAAPDDRASDEFQQYLQDQVTIRELYTFDPDVREANARCFQLFRKFREGGADHLSLAREIVDGYRHYFSILSSHKRFPNSMSQEEIDKKGLDSARSALENLSGTINKGVMDAIRKELFS